MRDVDLFVEEKGLQEYTDLIKKGALIAQDPAGFEYLEVLSTEEKDLLRHEATHRWSHPLRLYLTIIICSIGAAVQGWDQTGSNGANLSFPQEFGLDEENSVRDQWIVGLVNSIIFLTAGLM